MSSPYEIGVLMHYYTSPDPLPNAYVMGSNDLFESTINRFCRDEITETHLDNDHGYRLTLKGKAWAAAILSVQYPQSVFIDSAGNIIYMDVK